MPSVPNTQYAASGDVHIAYQTFGDGPDLIFSSGIFSNLDVMWDEPRWVRLLQGLASFARLTIFDMRGVGLSDRGIEKPILERQRDDIAAVMDAVGVDTAVVSGVARAAATALLFAATHPQRANGLILYSPGVRRLKSPAWPAGKTREEQAAFAARFVAEMGTGRNLALQAPSLADDPRFVDWWARFERLVASPSAYRELAEILTELDVSEVLPAIHVPTLVLHRSGDLINSVAHGQYVAERIEGARFVELAGDDHLPIAGDTDALLAEVEEFVTGARPAPRIDRILSTVMFTDMVDSTALQASLGDRAWKRILESHHAVVRRQLDRYGGREQDTAGDGFYVLFDGPARAIECAQQIMEELRPLGIEIRAGVHTGECEVVDMKCTGLAVSIAARVMSKASPSEILVSQTVKDLSAGGDAGFMETGEHELKGVPGTWRLYRVEAPQPRRK